MLSTSATLAADVLQSLSMWRIPVSPFEIAHQEGIVVKEIDAGPKFDARIEYYKTLKRFCIFYAKSEGWRTPGRVHFSVSHELGHFYLPEHRERLLRGEYHNSVTDFGSKDETELQADEFAADLLMPMELFRAQLDHFRNGFCDLDDLSTLANKLGTSITSTARRYCESDREPCTIFFSEGGLVQWGHPSEDMKRTGMFYHEYGTPPPRGSKTELLWQQINDGAAFDKIEGNVDAHVWFQWPRANRLWEAAMPLGKTGRVITQLTPDD